MNNYIIPYKSNIMSFNPINLSNLSLLLRPYKSLYINSLLAANFVSTNSEYLNSLNSVFNFGDEDFSFGCWVKFDTDTDDQIISKWNATGNQRSFTCQRVAADNKIYFLVSADGISITSVKSTNTTTPGSWYFVVCVHDSVNDIIKVSLNGSTFDSVSHSGGVFNSTQDFWIGGLVGATYMNGTIDAPFVYNRTLSQAEITALYNSGSGVDYSTLSSLQKVNLISWWTLNESSGTRSDSHGSYDLTDNNTVGYAQGLMSERVVNDYDSVYINFDESINSNDAIQSTITKQPYWINKKEIVFNGSSDDLEIDSVLTQLTASGTFSISSWIKPTTAISGEQIISFGDTNASTDFQLAKQIGTGKLAAFFRQSGTIKWSLISDSLIFTDNTWAHIGLSFNGSSATMYFNGEMVPSTYDGATTDQTWGFNNSSGLDNGRIGCRNFNSGGDTLFFTGSIGDQIITTDVITPDEMKNIYLSGKSIYF